MRTNVSFLVVVWELLRSASVIFNTLVPSHPKLNLAAGKEENEDGESPSFPVPVERVDLTGASIALRYDSAAHAEQMRNEFYKNGIAAFSVEPWICMNVKGVENREEFKKLIPSIFVLFANNESDGSLFVVTQHSNLAEEFLTAVRTQHPEWIIDKVQGVSCGYFLQPTHASTDDEAPRDTKVEEGLLIEFLKKPALSVPKTLNVPDNGSKIYSRNALLSIASSLSKTEKIQPRMIRLTLRKQDTTSPTMQPSKLGGGGFGSLDCGLPSSSTTFDTGSIYALSHYLSQQLTANSPPTSGTFQPNGFLLQGAMHPTSGLQQPDMSSSGRRVMRARTDHFPKRAVTADAPPGVLPPLLPNVPIMMPYPWAEFQQPALPQQHRHSLPSVDIMLTLQALQRGFPQAFQPNSNVPRAGVSSNANKSRGGSGEGGERSGVFGRSPSRGLNPTAPEFRPRCSISGSVVAVSEMTLAQRHVVAIVREATSRSDEGIELDTLREVYNVKYSEPLESYPWLPSLRSFVENLAPSLSLYDRYQEDEQSHKISKEFIDIRKLLHLQDPRVRTFVRFVDPLVIPDRRPFRHLFLAVVAEVTGYHSSSVHPTQKELLLKDFPNEWRARLPALNHLELQAFCGILRLEPYIESLQELIISRDPVHNTVESVKLRPHMSIAKIPLPQPRWTLSDIICDAPFAGFQHNDYTGPQNPFAVPRSPPLMSRLQLQAMVYSLVASACERQGSRWAKFEDLVDMDAGDDALLVLPSESMSLVAANNTSQQQLGSSDNEGEDGEEDNDLDDDTAKDSLQGDSSRLERRRRKKREKKEKKLRRKAKLRELEKQQTLTNDASILAAKTSLLADNPDEAPAPLLQGESVPKSVDFERLLSQSEDLRKRRQMFRNCRVGMLVSAIKAEWPHQYGHACPLSSIMASFGIRKLKYLLMEVPNLVLTGSGGFMRVTTVDHARKYCDIFPPLGLGVQGEPSATASITAPSDLPVFQKSGSAEFSAVCFLLKMRSDTPNNRSLSGDPVLFPKKILSYPSSIWGSGSNESFANSTTRFLELMSHNMVSSL